MQHNDRQLVFWLTIGLLMVVAVLVLKDILLPFVAGIVIAFAMNPLVDRLDRLGLPRVAAAALAVLAFFSGVILIFVYLVPLLAAQVQQLIASLPAELQKGRLLIEQLARDWLGDRFPAFQKSLEAALDQGSENWREVAQVIAQSLWSQGRAVIDFVAVVLITPVVVFYVLVDWNGMLQRIDGWLPRQHAPTLRRIATEMNDAISAFIRGQGLVCLILGVYYSVTLSIAGLDYGLLIGILTGAMSFVPFVGWALGLMVSASLAVVQGWPDLTTLWFVLAIFAGAQAADAAFLSPKIVGSRVGLHPVWLIFALFVFSYLFGVVGVLVAVPLAAATGVLVRFALSVYLASEYYTGEPRDGGLLEGRARDVGSERRARPRQGERSDE
ncbi:MAG: AI-2E family transporter [Hyphomicrobiaceae bacterium]